MRLTDSAPAPLDNWAPLPCHGFLQAARGAYALATEREKQERIARAVERGAYGVDYLFRSWETLRRFWDDPDTYGIKRGKLGLFTSDATSGIGIPQTSTEWTNAGFSGVSAPTHLWLCQDSGTPLANAIASTVTLASTGAGQSYLNAVTGWSAKSVNLTDNTAGSWTSTDTSLADLSATSAFFLVYVKIGTPAASRGLIQMDTTTNDRITVTSTPRLSVVSGGNTTNGSNSPNTGGVIPVFLQENRTAGSTNGGSHQDYVTPTHATNQTSAKRINLGGNAVVSGAFAYLYAANWVGGTAEISKPDVANMLSALGWTRTFSAAMVVALSESLSLSDSITALLAATQGVSETWTLSDSITALLAATPGVSEEVDGTDSVAASMGITDGLADSLTLSDVVTALLAATVGLSDSWSLSDSLAALRACVEILIDVSSLDEELAALLAASPGVTDSLSLTDSLASAVAMALALADEVDGTESLAAQLAATAALADEVDGDESLASAVAMSATLADSMSLAEVLATMMSASASVADSATLAEVLAALKAAAPALADDATLGNTLVASLGASAGLADAVALAEALAASFGAAPEMLDALALEEAVRAISRLSGHLGGAIALLRRLAGTVSTRAALSGRISKR